MEEVKVKTNGDHFASIEHERVSVEFTKDGDSPNCPNSWTFYMWFDGLGIAGTCDEMSYADTVKTAISDIEEIIGEYGRVLDYLKAFDAMGERRG